MPIYQTNDFTLLQIKEKKFLDKSKLKLNKTWIIHMHKWTQTYIDMCIYAHTKIISKKIITSIFQTTHTHTHTHKSQDTHSHTHTEK